MIKEKTFKPTALVRVSGFK